MSSPPMVPGYISRRSPVVALHGCVGTSQPLATAVGEEILRKGGNAADAAVGVIAALNVTEPGSCGIGGDAFCIYYNNTTKAVQGINGSGRAPAGLTLEYLNGLGYDENNPIPSRHALNITVPGAAACWVDTVETFGSGQLTLMDIMEPAIKLAENGFPVHLLSAMSWKGSEGLFTNPSNRFGGDMLLNGQAPRTGEIMTLPLMAQTFRELATNGKKGYYEGRIAQAISDVVKEHGGVMEISDLKVHESTFDVPIYTDYKGVRVYEMPPNGQGITALMALNILEGIPGLKEMGHNSTQYLHHLIESLRLSFADTTYYVADPAKVSVPVTGMLSKEYANERRALIDPNRAIEVTRGNPPSSDTVYFTVVDGDGNACSFICSNYQGFGTALVPEGCGFTLQNRGANFTLETDHPNVVAPDKRPYHTIIPALATSATTGDLLASFGVMGGFMQPQGHVQVLLNMFEFGMDPQTALDEPRFCIQSVTSTSQKVSMEDGIPDSVMQELSAMGHTIEGPITNSSRSLFGRGQIITKGAWWLDARSEQDKVYFHDDKNVYWVGSDPRADGMAGLVL
ncbi:glutathione hydrolase-like YwrD proenzyme [Ptychodera flava]|uniref:glutathione hydrolase-like YwrD proenzyme n=1 Tax=Ptychodera flava TaxID=63121 RepID=UPI003969EFA5